MDVGEAGVREVVPAGESLTSGSRPIQWTAGKTYVLVSPYSIAGDLRNCLPFLQRRHLNRSCVCPAVESVLGQ